MNQQQIDNCKEAVSILRNMDGISIAHKTARQKWADAIETQYLIGAADYDVICASMAFSIICAERRRLATVIPADALQLDGDAQDEAPRPMLPPVTIRPLKQLGEPGALYDVIKPVKTQEIK